MKIIFLAISLMIAATSANAWHAALLVVNSSGATVHQVGPASSAQEALNLAKKECIGWANTSSSCRVIGEPQNGAFISVFRGQTGFGFGAAKNAKDAANIALADCEKKSKECRPLDLFRVEKTLHAAVALGKKGFYVSTDKQTPEEARESAINLCNKHDAANKCVLKPDLGTHKFVVYATASSIDGKSHGINRGYKIEDVQRAALKECEKVSGSACQLVVKEAWNGDYVGGPEDVSYMREFMEAVLAAKKATSATSPSPTPKTISIESVVKRDPLLGCPMVWNTDHPTNPHMIPSPHCR